MTQILRFREAAFDPETIQIMATAFNKAKMRLDNSAVPASIIELLADRIIEFTRQGERDPDRLCAKSLAVLGGETACRKSA